MDNNKNNKKKAKFRMPWPHIALVALLMMLVSFFVLDSPICFWLSFVVCVAACVGWSGRWLDETKDCPLPWWYGGL